MKARGIQLLGQSINIVNLVIKKNLKYLFVCLFISYY